MDFWNNETWSYLAVDRPAREAKWQYAARALEEELRCRFLRKILRGVWVDMNGYVESFGNHPQVIDLTHMGGSTLLVFDDEVLELLIHGKGMLTCRSYAPDEIRVEKRRGPLPEDLFHMDDFGRFFLDTASTDIGDASFLNEPVEDIRVYGAESWCFNLPGFEDEKAEIAAAKGDLPTAVDWILPGGRIRLIGDNIEYYTVSFEPNDPKGDVV